MPNHGALETWQTNETYQPLGNVPTGRYVSKRTFLHNKPQVRYLQLFTARLRFHYRLANHLVIQSLGIFLSLSLASLRWAMGAKERNKMAFHHLLDILMMKWATISILSMATATATSTTNATSGQGNTYAKPEIVLFIAQC